MTGPRYRPGQRVRIAARTPAVHHRVPAYVKGKVGTIERVCGKHGEPERHAAGKSLVLRRLYRVRIAQQELWDGYQGAPQDKLDIEIFEHWLEDEV